MCNCTWDGHFCHLSIKFLPLSFLSILERKHFGRLEEKTPMVHQIFSLSSLQPNTQKKKFSSYFLSKVFHPPYFTSKQKHPKFGWWIKAIFWDLKKKVLFLYFIFHSTHYSINKIYTFATNYYFIFIKTKSQTIKINQAN